MSPSERQIEEREARKQRILKGALEAVSYTHLTLPTTGSV